MASQPVVSGSEAIRAFERAGWQGARQRGSHVSLVKSGVSVNLSNPLHRELAGIQQRGEDAHATEGWHGRLAYA